MANIPPTSSVEMLATVLLENQLCDTTQEATAISDAILQDVSNKVGIEKSLQEYFELGPDQARLILDKAMKNNGKEQEEDSDTSSDSDDNETEQETIKSDDDGEVIGEGECELCERLVQLTRHHLIPKSTHARIEPKLLHAAAALQQGDVDKARVILGPGLEHSIPSLAEQQYSQKFTVRRILQRTCNICRPCHSALHNTHDNMTLALHYNTAELLLNDTAIYKFCQWANKQKPGKYAIKPK